VRAKEEKEKTDEEESRKVERRIQDEEENLPFLTMICWGEGG